MKRLILGLIFVLSSGIWISQAQVTACDASGKQIVAHRWDVVLGHEWEMVRDCRHPEWPARVQAVKALVLGQASSSSSSPASVVAQPAGVTAPAKEPIVVHAGDTIRLWQRAAFVRMEMSGVAEQPARRGDHIEVRVTHQNDDGSTSTARISGTVRAAGDVEMDQ